MSTSYLVRLYPRSDSGLALHYSLFGFRVTIVAVVKRSAKFNHIAGGTSLGGLVSHTRETEWH